MGILCCCCYGLEELLNPPEGTGLCDAIPDCMGCPDLTTQCPNLNLPEWDCLCVRSAASLHRFWADSGCEKRFSWCCRTDICGNVYDSIQKKMEPLEECVGYPTRLLVALPKRSRVLLAFIFAVFGGCFVYLVFVAGMIVLIVGLAVDDTITVIVGWVVFLFSGIAVVVVCFLCCVGCLLCCLDATNSCVDWWEHTKLYLWLDGFDKPRK